MTAAIRREQTKKAAPVGDPAEAVIFVRIRIV